MSQVAISGNASGTGTLTIAAPNTNSNYTLTLPAATTTLVGTNATQTLTNKTLTSPTITGAVMSSMASSVITSGTAVASTSGTSIDFTGIPSWAKRITVMFSGVSLSATAQILVQLGTGSTTYTTSGYLSSSSQIASTTAVSNATTGFNVRTDGASQIVSGTMTIVNITGNSWVSSHSAKQSSTTTITGGGDISLSAVLTAVRITSTSTDTFDAGTINILYE